MSTIEQIRQTAESLRAELASPDAPPPTLEEARALAEAAIGLVEENAKLRAKVEAALSGRHEWTRYEQREGWTVCARCGQVRNFDDRAGRCRGSRAKMGTSTSPESDTDQFTRGLGTAPICPGCRKPVTDVPFNEKPKPEAIVEHHDCLFPARGARWTLPEPAERKPVAGWVSLREEGDMFALNLPPLRVVAYDAESPGDRGFTLAGESEDESADLLSRDDFASLNAMLIAAEDALFAIADAINALRGGR